MLNFGPLSAEIVRDSGVWGTPASWLRYCTEVNQTLHDVWPSAGLVHYMYISRGSCPLTEFCQLQNSLCVQILRSPILTALLHGTRAVGVSQTLRRSAEGATYGGAWQDHGRAAMTLGTGAHSSLPQFGSRLRISSPCSAMQLEMERNALEYCLKLMIRFRYRQQVSAVTDQPVRRAASRQRAASR